jgi:hypothetical protein
MVPVHEVGCIFIVFEVIIFCLFQTGKDRFQKFFGSQRNSATAILKKRMAAPRISFLSRGSPHLSPTPHRKRTIPNKRVFRT